MLELLIIATGLTILAAGYALGRLRHLAQLRKAERLASLQLRMGMALMRDRAAIAAETCPVNGTHWRRDIAAHIRRLQLKP